MHTWKFIQFTAFLDAGINKNLSKTSSQSGSESTNQSQFALNDRFYLNNFKGISNIGEREFKETVFTNNKSKKQTSKLNCGFDKYL